jgi:hypothetical protein
LVGNPADHDGSADHIGGTLFDVRASGRLGFLLSFAVRK